MKNIAIYSLLLPLGISLFSGCELSSRNSDLNPLVAQLEKVRCDYWEDRQSLPHVRGADDRTALACLGYVHARDRIWEMDYFRRIAQGRRAEILGKDQIKADFQMRVLGLHERARELFPALTQEAKDSLWAYTYGVNQGMRAALAAGVYEFKELGYEPEPWRPEDTVALVLLQSFDQTRRSFGRDLEEQEWAEGREAGVALEWAKREGLPWETTVLKSGEYAVGKKVGARSESTRSTVSHVALAAAIEDYLPDLPGGVGMGSNNWVIAPSRSRTGKAWLANDPHVRLHYPSLWHWAHFEGDRLNVIGAAFPGIPVVVSGANTRAAWGITNSYLDVGRLALVPEADLKDAPSFRPLIWIKWWRLKLPFFFKTFKRTLSGQPVLPLPAPEGKALVLSWVTLGLNAEEMSSTLTALLEMMKGGTVAEVDAAFQGARVPTWNFVFADTTGAIGYRAVGKIPRQEGEPAFGIVERRLQEWESELRSLSYLGVSEMPNVQKPSRGFIVTANNRHWPSEAKFHGGRVYRPGFRAFRIEELLLATPKHDLASLKRVQCDVQAVDARFLFSPMFARLSAEQRGSAAGKLLAAWNFEADLECQACAVFRLWLNGVLDAFRGDEAMLYHALQEKDSSLNVLLVNNFDVAVHTLEQAGAGFDPWGRLHRNRFPHLADPQFFGDQAIGTAGDDESVNPGTSSWNGKFFDHTGGASQRLVVELASPPRVYSVLPSSIRDLPSRDLNDPAQPWQQWKKCQLLERNFPVDWRKVEKKVIAFE